jgi:hypothetical protein
MPYSVSSGLRRCLLRMYRTYGVKSVSSCSCMKSTSRGMFLDTCDWADGGPSFGHSWGLCQSPRAAADRWGCGVAGRGMFQPRAREPKSQGAKEVKRSRDKRSRAKAKIPKKRQSTPIDTALRRTAATLPALCLCPSTLTLQPLYVRTLVSYVRKELSVYTVPFVANSSLYIIRLGAV